VLVDFISCFNLARLSGALAHAAQLVDSTCLTLVAGFYAQHVALVSTPETDGLPKFTTLLLSNRCRCKPPPLPRSNSLLVMWLRWKRQPVAFMARISILQIQLATSWWPIGVSGTGKRLWSEIRNQQVVPGWQSRELEGGQILFTTRYVNFGYIRITLKCTWTASTLVTLTSSTLQV